MMGGSRNGQCHRRPVRLGGRATLTRAIVVRAVCLGTFPFNLSIVREMCVGIQGLSTSSYIEELPKLYLQRVGLKPRAARAAISINRPNRNCMCFLSGMNFTEGGSHKSHHHPVALQ
jgi:hypothetical protein